MRLETTIRITVASAEHHGRCVIAAIGVAALAGFALPITPATLKADQFMILVIAVLTIGAVFLGTLD